MRERRGASRVRLGRELLLLGALVTAVPVVGGMTGWIGQVAYGASATRAPEDTDVKGARVYAVYCAVCHGKGGEGGLVANAPPLNGTGRLSRLSDRELVTVIAEGRPGTLMKAWSRQRGGELTDEEIGAVVTFLRSRSPRRQR